MIEVLKLTPAGSAGSAAASATSDILRGNLMGVKIDYTSQPGTTDVTIAEADGLQRTILTRTNTATDGTFYPSAALADGSGSGHTQYVPYYVEGKITVTVAQGDPVANGVIVYLLVQDRHG